MYVRDQEQNGAWRILRYLEIKQVEDDIIREILKYFHLNESETHTSAFVGLGESGAAAAAMGWRARWQQTRPPPAGLPLSGT